MAQNDDHISDDHHSDERSPTPVRLLADSLCAGRRKQVDRRTGASNATGRMVRWPPSRLGDQKEGGVKLTLIYSVIADPPVVTDPSREACLTSV
jgi:hypothetical protein